MSNWNKWSDEEERILRERIEDHQQSEIANILGRTQKSINNKAWRLGLSNHSGKTIRRQGRELSVPQTDTNFSHFISGFVAGEGSFNVVERGEGPKYQFSISMSSVDTEILYRIQDYLDVGHVYEYPSREDHWKDTTQYQVANQVEMIGVIIPFFDGVGLYNTHKQTQYKKMKDHMRDYLDIETLK